MPTSSMPCSSCEIASSSWKALAYGPTGSLQSPPITWISRSPCSSNHPTISLRCALPATSRAAMCGTTRKLRCSSLSLNCRVLSIPFVGEQVTATFASTGRWPACSSAPLVGRISNLGRDSISALVIGERLGPLVRPGRTSLQVCFDGLLSRIYERFLDDGGLVLAGLHPHGQHRPQIGKLDGHQGVPDVLLEARRPERRGDLPYLRAVVDDLQVVFYVTYQGVAIELYADHLAAHALIRDASERLLANKVGLLIQLHRVPQVRLVRVQEVVVTVVVVVQRDVGAVAQDSGLDPPDLTRPDRREVVRLAGLEHHIPELHAVAAGVPEVDLEPHLTSVTGPRDHDVHAVEIVLLHPVVFEVEDLLAEDVHHQVPGAGTLDLDRGDVGLSDLHVQTGDGGHALGPEQHVAVSHREPEVVLAKAQEHRVVDDAAVDVGVEGEFALLDRAPVQVARG